MKKTLIAVFLMALVTYLPRVLPMAVFRKEITSDYIKSFLYYVPYVTLAVMTFPAMVTAPQIPLAGILALLIGIAAAWKGLNMVGIAVLCCVVVFVCETAAVYFM